MISKCQSNQQGDNKELNRGGDVELHGPITMSHCSETTLQTREFLEF